MPEDAKAEYVSKFLGYTIKLKPTRTMIVDGIRVKDPGIYVEFRNGSYKTSDPEIIKRLDALLNGPNANRYKNMFYKKPGRATIEKAKRVVRELEKKREEFMAEAKADMETEKVSEFEDFLDKKAKVQKEQTPTKKGIIDL